MNNIYEQFRKYVSQLEYPKDIMVEYHHEPPHHTGRSSDSSEMNVIASLEHHALLHYYRWLSYEEIQDKIAWMWRKGQDKEARILMNENRIKTCKETKSGFYNSELQSELGRRGAYASHKIQKENLTGRWNSQTQREIALLGNTPEVRKKKGEGGKIGGKKSSEVRKKMGVGVYSPESRRKGNLLANLSRWGITINGERIPRDFLPQEFIDWFLIHKQTKFIISQSESKLLTLEEKVQRLLGELGVTRNTSKNAQNNQNFDC
jgi:hypothetical protein